MMRRSALPLALAASLIGTSGCAPHLASSPQTPLSVIALDPDQALAGRQTGTLTLELRWPEAERQTQAFPVSTTAFRLTVSGPDFAPAITALVTRPQGAATSSVQVTVPAGTERSLAAEALNGAGRTLAAGSATGLTVSPGVFTAVELSLVSAVGDVGGVVTHPETGLPLADVTVSAGDRSTVSDAMGRYRLTDLPTGSVTVGLSAAHFDPATFSAYVLPSTESVAASQALTPQHWFEQVSGVGYHLDGVQALSANEAWAWGQSNLVLHTIDGGFTWRGVPIATSGYVVTHLQMLDSQLGFAAAHQSSTGTFLRTTDGGQSWTALNKPLDWIYRFNAVSSVSITAAVRNYYGTTPYRTTDGGQSWTGANTASLGDSALVNPEPDLYYAMGTGAATIYRSSSGGMAWSSYDLSPLYSDSYARTPLYATSSALVYMCGRYRPVSSDVKFVATSTDGGITFNPIFTTSSTDGGGFRAVGAWGDGLAAVGTGGTIGMQAPGDSWRVVPTHARNASSIQLNGFSFYDRLNGWAVGDNGKILKY